ncbi:hexosaminidase [Arthrobacter stackebrandtii]|uniref:beta-N-acetylhexosaminidase n=1 Tax=Arthrobacter stackebrandtii TaxID=272161 RepID=A0ABS4Z237_9MICC|nr:beta-N-acetylhexosaminidase [Arthrobacter stackebrandtii]MBP2415056.1 hexosaminidase [Arthrobacter stackebrandtii]
MTAPNLVPVPWSLQDNPLGAAVRLDGGTTLSSDPQLAPARRWLARALGAATGWDLPPHAAGTEAADIAFVLDGSLAEEGYTLTVDATVQVRAAGSAGAFYAAQTLLQLLGAGAFRQAPLAEKQAWLLPALTIADKPRFGYRGVMLDVARHFLPKDDVLRFIEVAAMHKLNILHLHLSDDQGWRMEINRYPLLTEVGAWRRESSLGAWRAGVYDGQPHGGFYTQDDLREIVAFAAERNITVIPEIDVPGHSQAAIAAYPELGPAGGPVEVWTRWGINTTVLDPSDFAVDFYKNVLDEVMDIFPSPWISVGGDEVPPGQWEAGTAARDKAAALGLDSVAGLHGWFIAQLAEHLQAAGRKTAVWDEVGEFGLPDGVLVHAWRGSQGGLDALAGGHDVVVCPEHRLYLDHRQADGDGEPVPVGFVTTLEDVYSYDPSEGMAGGEFPGRLLGAQANIWTEHLPTARRVDYAAYPRLSALAEVFWSNPWRRDFSEFQGRLTGGHLDRLAAMGVEYRPLDGPLPWQQRPGIAGWKRDYEQECRDAAAGIAVGEPTGTGLQADAL